MKHIIRFWCFWLLPAKFYGGGGGGGTQIVNQDNPQQQALANVAQQKYNWYQQKYVPLENSWMEQVNGMNGPGYNADAAGMAENTIKQNAGNQTAEVGKSMVNGRLGSSNLIDLSGNTSGAATSATTGVTDRMIKGQQGVVAMGQGQSTGAIGGLSDVARQSVAGQSENANNQFSIDQANNGIYGTVAGMGAASAMNTKFGK